MLIHMAAAEAGHGPICNGVNFLPNGAVNISLLVHPFTLVSMSAGSPESAPEMERNLYGENILPRTDWDSREFIRGLLFRRIRNYLHLWGAKTFLNTITNMNPLNGDGSNLASTSEVNAF